MDNFNFLWLIIGSIGIFYLGCISTLSMLLQKRGRIRINRIIISIPFLTQIIKETREKIYLQEKDDKMITPLIDSDYSYYPLTVIFSVKRGQTFEKPYIYEVSPRANEFFGFSRESKELYGKTTEDLIDILKQWMDEQDYEAFVTDQIRLLKEYRENSEEEIEKEPILAEKPILFNNKHRYPAFRNKTFIPIIITYDNKHRIADIPRESLCILYLNIDKIPRQLLIKE